MKQNKTKQNQLHISITYLWLTSLFLPSYLQFRRAPEDSARKSEAQKQLAEAMVHRAHIDNSIKLIGKLLFGLETGPQVINSIRPSGQPLVDDWICLKSLVTN